MDRAFGAEIELTGITRAHAMQVLRLVGCDIREEEYNHVTRAWWKIVPDGSIRDGFEVVSPVLRGQRGVTDVMTVVTALDDAGGRVDRRCGLHVHLDGNGFDVEQVRSVIRRYAKYEDEIDTFMPPSRRGNDNRYCRSIRPFVEQDAFIRAGNVRELVQAQPDRYFKVNLKSLEIHRTLEFRQHSGTLNVMKVRNWLAFIDGFVRESCRLAGLREEEIPPVITLPALQPKLARLARMLLEHPDGMNSETLQQALHVQPHSLRANMTYLRRAGVNVESHRRRGETVYRINGADTAPRNVQPADTGLFAGMPPDVVRFYHNRALVLNNAAR
jgi:biotin operon repressor